MCSLVCSKPIVAVSFKPLYGFCFKLKPFVALQALSGFSGEFFLFNGICFY